jgi:hypothetical protein
VEGHAVHIPDVFADPPIGVIILWRKQVRPCRENTALIAVVRHHLLPKNSPNQINLKRPFA